LFVAIGDIIIVSLDWRAWAEDTVFLAEIGLRLALFGCTWGLVCIWLNPWELSTCKVWKPRDVSPTTS
jgi:hypothetical protein